MDTTSLPTGTVTFLFTDIEGSTRLWEQFPDRMRHALGRHHALLTQGIEQHGGVVVKSQGEGDSFFAVFSDPVEALSAAAALQRALTAEPWPAETPLRVRMALHTGEAELRGGDYYGPTVNRCARLRTVAHGGQVLLSGATADRVREHLGGGASLRDLGLHRLKDLQQPERLFQLLHPDLAADFPPLRSLDARPNNLPVQPTPLVGREQEVSTLREMLLREGAPPRSGGPRLVTLTGPGGTGKTRLAVQVAADLVEEFNDGVFLADLAPITDPTLVISTLAQALGVRAFGGQSLLETTKSFLREKRLLLVLDNFEQVLDAAPVVAELLATASGLKVLVTSRTVLRLRGEYEFAVSQLALPDPKRLPPVELLSRYPAVELFIQRAVAARSDFVVTPENAPALAEICVRLDGLPLAIELAAARIRLFSPPALLSRLENRLNVLTGGARDLPARQQTLRSAIGWSYDLLKEGEKTLFRRLSVFVGGFTLQAAEAVCNPEADGALDVLEGVSSLVYQSLLRREEGVSGEPRFSTFETIREYGLECLAHSGEEEAIRRRHAQFFLALTEEIEPRLRRRVDRERSLEQLDQEHDNLRAALTWSHGVDHGSEIALRLAGALESFWSDRGHWREGRQWLEAALARVEGEPPASTLPPAVRAKGLYAAASMALWGGGDTGVAVSRLEASAALWRQVGDRYWLAMVLRDLGVHTSGRSLLEEALALSREEGDRLGAAQAHNMLGHVALWTGDLAAARSHYEQSVTIAREIGDPGYASSPLVGLGRVAWREGDYGAARSFYEESAVWRRQKGGHWLTTNLCDLGAMAYEQGDYGRAADLFQESLSLPGSHWNSTKALSGLAAVAWRQGDYETAHSLCRQSLAIGREQQDERSIAQALTLLGLVARDEGDAERARSLLAEGLAVWRELVRRRDLEAQPGLALCLEGLAGAVLACRERAATCRTDAGGNTRPSRLARVARLLGAAEALREAIQCPLPPIDRADHQSRVATARAALGERKFAAAWAQGRAMPPDEAIAYALEEFGPDA